MVFHFESRVLRILDKPFEPFEPIKPHLQNIDIGIVGFGTSHGRERVVDFGISFLPGGVRMATKKDAATEEYFFFLRPFSTGVW